MGSCRGEPERTGAPDQSQQHVAKWFESVILPLQFMRTS